MQWVWLAAGLILLAILAESDRKLFGYLVFTLALVWAARMLGGQALSGGGSAIPGGIPRDFGGTGGGGSYPYSGGISPYTGRPTP